VILFWLLPLFVGLHIFEEFVYPGGFSLWYQNYKPSLAASITPRFLIIVNAILVLLTIIPIVIGTRPYGVALWLAIAAVLFGNSTFHIRGAFVSQKYSPGVVTSVLFYLPLSVVGFWFFISNGRASLGTALSSLVIGLSYQWFSSYNHRRRSRNL
jgi:hypothetical protein